MTSPEPDIAGRAQALARLLEEEGLHELTLETRGEILRLKRRPSSSLTGWSGPYAPAPEIGPTAPGPQAGPSEAGPGVEPVPLTSPVVGLAHLPGNQDGRPGVMAGQPVCAGDILLFVESMGLHHEIRSRVDGSVLEILVHEGEPVEYGQALALIQPDGSRPAPEAW